MKGQSSLEFVIIIGFATLMASPFILESQASLIDTSQSSREALFQSSFDEFREKVERVNTMGPPATDEIRLDIPSDMKDVEVREGNKVVYTRDVPKGQKNYTAFLDTDIKSANLPLEEGRPAVRIRAVEGGVELGSSETRNIDMSAGTLQVPGSTGNLNITGVGFKPDLIKFQITATNTNFDTETEYGGDPNGWGIGFADCSSGSCDEVSQTIGKGSASIDDHIASSSNDYSVLQAVTNNDGDNLQGWINGSVSSTHNQGFLMNFDAVYQQEYVKYTAFNFPERSDVDVGSFETPASEQIKSVDTGFKPDYINLVGTNTLDVQGETFPIGSKTETEATFGWSHGIATSDRQRVISYSANSYNINGRAAAGSDNQVLNLLFSDQNGIVQSRTNASLDSMDYSGFNLEFDRVSDSSGTHSKFDTYPIIYAAVATGLDVRVDHLQTPTTESDQAIDVVENTGGITFTGINTLPEMNRKISDCCSDDDLYGISFGDYTTSVQQSLGYSTHADSVSGHASMSSDSDSLYLLYADEFGGILGNDRGNVKSVSGDTATIEWTNITTSSTGNVPYDSDVFMYTAWSGTKEGFFYR